VIQHTKSYICVLHFDIVLERCVDGLLRPQHVAVLDKGSITIAILHCSLNKTAVNTVVMNERCNFCRVLKDKFV